MTPMFITRTTDVAARMLGGCMMIMSARDSSLFSLNEVGSVIWNAADGSTSLAEIVENAVCTQFEVSPSEALADAEQFVRQLAEHGILTISAEPLDTGSGARRR